MSKPKYGKKSLRRVIRRRVEEQIRLAEMLETRSPGSGRAVLPDHEGAIGKHCCCLLRLIQVTVGVAQTVVEIGAADDEV